LLVGCGTAAVLFAPAVANAATKTVYMGLPTAAASKAFQKDNADVNAYFPSGTTIHVGDKVSFVVHGFHTIDLPARGGSPAGLVAPTGAMIANENDAAGSPFWFNGQPQFGFNSVLVTNQGFGKSFTYNTSKTILSGLPFADKPKPMNVKFTKKGTYSYYCDVHPGMKGTVHVVAKTAKAPSKRADAKAVRAQVAAAQKILANVDKFKPGSGTIQIGGAGKKGVESYNFFPASTSVKVGTTMTFRMPTGSTEVHTATTGPGDPEKEPSSYLGTLAASVNSPAFAGAAFYSSEQPGGTPASLTPTLHGNGFWNAGFLDVNKNTPLAPSNQVTFAAPGTYTFHCLIHPFMKATVTVTP
jgi:plastocyanin